MPPAVAPAGVTQFTCKEVLGLKDHKYLEYLRDNPDFPRWKIGQVVMTDPRDWQRLIVPVDADTETPADDRDLEQPLDEVDARRRLGLQRKARTA